MTARALNFGAGPATLPQAVLDEARDEFLSLAGSGMSILEVSHRSPEYGAIHAETQAKLKKLCRLDDRFEVLFCPGGATTQFSMIAENLLGPGKVADYILTGSWSKKAVKEAKSFGDVRVAASGEAEGFCAIPKREAWQLAENARYLHITTNNTIAGTQWFQYPVVDAPLIADMSSDMLWRDYGDELSRFSLFYAGAQKNLGPAGVAVVVIRQDLLEQCRKDLPGMRSYAVQAETKSLFNTPPCFAIYMVGKVLAWIEAQGGLAAVEQRNRAKANLLYGTIDKHRDFYRSPVAEDCRSMMNVVFRLPSEDLEKRFLQAAKDEGMVGLKGHRSVGGMRASIYNAAPQEWIEQLTQLMESFVSKNG